MSDSLSPASSVTFTCWNCKTVQTLDLRMLQKDRLDADYVEVVPQPENPRRFHLRCPDCAKFNTVHL
jgi:hypothetical protein